MRDKVLNIEEQAFVKEIRELERAINHFVVIRSGQMTSTQLGVLQSGCDVLCDIAWAVEHD